MARYLVPILLLLSSSDICAESHLLRSPRLYSIAGIATGGFLNVRAESTVQSADLGDLLSNAPPIEITALSGNGKWGRIIWQESTAWVSMAYLKPYSAPMLGDTAIPVGLLCYGTEPFWHYSIDSDSSVILGLNGGEKSVIGAIRAISKSANRSQFPVAINATMPDQSLVALLRPQQCDDGMSDRLFGWSADIFIQRADASTLVSGCCYYPRGE